MSGDKLNTLIPVYNKLYLFSKTYEMCLTYCGLHNYSQTTEQGQFGPNLKAIVLVDAMIIDQSRSTYRRAVRRKAAGRESCS